MRGRSLLKGHSRCWKVKSCKRSLGVRWSASLERLISNSLLKPKFYAIWGQLFFLLLKRWSLHSTHVFDFLFHILWRWWSCYTFSIYGLWESAWSSTSCLTSSCEKVLGPWESLIKCLLVITENAHVLPDLWRLIALLLLLEDVLPYLSGSQLCLWQGHLWVLACRTLISSTWSLKMLFSTHLRMMSVPVLRDWAVFVMPQIIEEFFHLNISWGSIAEEATMIGLDVGVTTRPVLMILHGFRRYWWCLCEVLRGASRRKEASWECIRDRR